MESDRPTTTVIFPRLSAATVGQFFYMYEVAVSYMGELLEINTYDQPAVQLGKDATYALMGKPGHEPLRKKIMPVATKSAKHLL
jgi:glucose-6-phosphate isomerase